MSKRKKQKKNKSILSEWKGGPGLGISSGSHIPETLYSEAALPFHGRIVYRVPSIESPHAHSGREHREISHQSGPTVSERHAAAHALPEILIPLSGSLASCHGMSFQDRCPYKEGTGARDGEAVKKIDSHHFLGLCIICRGCCCHNTATAALARGNVKANDVLYTANATNVLFLGTFRQLTSTPVWIFSRTQNVHF